MQPAFEKYCRYTKRAVTISLNQLFFGNGQHLFHKSILFVLFFANHIARLYFASVELFSK